MGEHEMTETTTAGPEARAGSGEPDGVIEDLSSWLEENWDPDLTVGEWWERLGLEGWAAPGLPPNAYGRGLSRNDTVRVQSTIAEHGALGAPGGLGLLLAAPTIATHGTQAQIDRYVRRIVTGVDAWCQLFSEPGAGSDLAGLTTRAVEDGDEYVVNGQKVWTSNAQYADFGILVARTDPDVPKHAGLTFFIVDMRTPGIEIRPLVQAQGVAHFNEVFLSDVRIPAGNVVGEVGDGWAVTRTTLRSESSMISGAGQATPFTALLALARQRNRTSDAVVRQELARAYSNELIQRWMGWRTQTAVMTGRYELALHGSLLKNFFTRSFTHKVGLAIDLEGAEGMLSDDAEGGGFWQYQFLNQFASKIGGGTEEVHRNNLGEQALGLPREPSVDRDVPWNQTRRS